LSFLFLAHLLHRFFLFVNATAEKQLSKVQKRPITVLQMKREVDSNSGRPAHMETFDLLFAGKVFSAHMDLSAFAQYTE
jgi:hypothetical protein